MAKLGIDTLTREMVRLVRHHLPWACVIPKDYSVVNPQHKVINLELFSNLDCSLDDFSPKYLMPAAKKLADFLNAARIDYYYILPNPKTENWAVVEYDGLFLRGVLSNTLQWNDFDMIEKRVLSFDCMMRMSNPPDLTRLMKEI